MGVGIAKTGKNAHGASALWSWQAGGGARPAGLETRSVGELTIVHYHAAEGAGWTAREEGLAAPRGLVLLLALTKAECAFKGDDRRWKAMRPREVLVAEGGAPVEIRPEAGARLAGLAMPAHLLCPRFLTSERLKSAHLRSHGMGMAALLYDLLDRFAETEAASRGAGALTDAVGGLLSATLEDFQAQERPPRGEAGRARFDQIGRHLRRHFADPDLSAEDVANAVGVSRRYLHRLYAQYGRSFRGELVALRIESCVKSFLDETQIHKTIAEIAFAAGYTDISQFNRHFRRLKGATPSALRRAVNADIALAEPKVVGRPVRVAA